MMRSESTKTAITVVSSTGAFRYSGTQPRGKAQVSRNPAAPPIRIASTLAATTSVTMLTLFASAPPWVM